MPGAAPHVLLPLVNDNRLHGESFGAEPAADASLTDWWGLDAACSYLEVDLHHEEQRPPHHLG